MPLIVEKIDAILSRHDMPRYLISIIEQSIQIRVKGVLMAPEQRWISVDFLSTLLLQLWRLWSHVCLAEHSWIKGRSCNPLSRQSSNAINFCDSTINHINTLVKRGSIFEFTTYIGCPTV